MQTVGHWSSDMAVALVEMHPFKSELCDIPDGMAVRPGDIVVIQDDDGEDVGKVVSYEDSDESRSVVLRAADEADLKRRQELDDETGKALEVFCRLKAEYGLGMRVVGAHWRLDRKKICFFFASEERFDFRALHKAVSIALDSRVSIKQVGVRDPGPTGRPSATWSSHCSHCSRASASSGSCMVCLWDRLRKALKLSRLQP